MQVFPLSVVLEVYNLLDVMVMLAMTRFAPGSADYDYDDDDDRRRVS